VWAASCGPQPFINSSSLTFFPAATEPLLFQRHAQKLKSMLKRALKKKRKGAELEEAYKYIFQARCSLAAQPNTVHSWGRTSNQSAESNNSAAKDARRYAGAAGFLKWHELFRTRYLKKLADYDRQKKRSKADPFQAYSAHWRKEFTAVCDESRKLVGKREVKTHRTWDDKDPLISVSRSSTSWYNVRPKAEGRKRCDCGTWRAFPCADLIHVCMVR